MTIDGRLSPFKISLGDRSCESGKSDIDDVVSPNKAAFKNAEKATDFLN